MIRDKKDDLIELEIKDLMPVIYDNEGLEDPLCDLSAAIEVNYAMVETRVREVLLRHWSFVREIILTLPKATKEETIARLDYQRSILKQHLESDFGDEIARTAEALEEFNKKLRVILS